MLSPRLTNCVDCNKIPNLLSSIDCKLKDLANKQYNNIVFALNYMIDSDIMNDLLNYKRILRYKFCNPNYTSKFSIEQIANKVRMLSYGVDCSCDCKYSDNPPIFFHSSDGPFIPPTTTTSTSSTTTTTTVISYAPYIGSLLFPGPDSSESITVQSNINNGGSPLTSVVIYYSTTNNPATPSDSSSVVSLPITDNTVSHLVTELSPETGYYFSIYATNINGTVSFSYSDMVYTTP